MAMKIALVALLAILLVQVFFAPPPRLLLTLASEISHYTPRIWQVVGFFILGVSREEPAMALALLVKTHDACINSKNREEPCDGLDACCKDHDACINSKNNNLLDVECSQTLLDCITKFRNSGEATFPGNNCSVSEVVNEIYAVIEAALWAGRLIP
ncbi:hypothetical protein H6P81_003101 [Aristolochia fimbriata]|uniref:Uncharacterized protein n=1 Tax=Aristolochia fimbriata TaxID=158543 RepID=A0AAV7FCD7_ARIFI|nr:hypothetical protein H6P81_003101 [Aristolochia fimbriata]